MSRPRSQARLSASDDAGLRPGVVIAAIFVVALLPLLSTPMLPFIDLYNHLARYFVLSHLDVNPLFRQNYAANWSLLPNIGLDVAGTALLTVARPALAAHIVVGAIFAVQFGGIMTFNRVLTGRWSPFVALMLVPLLYSFILNWGFANFLFGLGMVFATAAYWLAKRDHPWRALPVACLMVVAVFLCHGLTFALYGLLAGALEIGIFLRRPARRLGDLAMALLPLALQAVIPVLLFLSAPTSHAADGLTNADEAVVRLSQSGELSHRLWDLFCYRLTTIVRVAEGPNLWFDIATFIVTAVLLAMLMRRGRLAVDRIMWPALGVGLLLVAVMPPALFGVGYVFDRMPLFLALIFVAGLTTRFTGDATERRIVGALAALIGLRLVLIALGWRDYATEYRQFQQLAERVPRGAMVLDIAVGGSPRLSAAPRCAMYRPLLVSTRGVIAPLFANETQQPLKLIGPLRAAAARVKYGPAWGGRPTSFYSDLVTTASRSGFDYGLICNAEALVRPLPAGSRVVARTSTLTLVEFGQAARFR